MTKPFTITAAEAAAFDPSAQRVTRNPDGSSTTESGPYITGLDAAVPRAGTEMPKPVSKK